MDRRTRLCVPADPFALGTPQGREQAKPGAFEAQAAKVIEHGLPGREVAWQIAPGTASSQGPGEIFVTFYPADSSPVRIAKGTKRVWIEARKEHLRST